MTGDASVLDGLNRPNAPGLGDLSGGLSHEEGTRVRALALEAFTRFRGESKRPAIPTREALERMMAFCAGEPIPKALAELGLEELALHEQDPRRREIDQRAVANANRRGFRVVIIGGGMSGLLLAYRLAQQGIDFCVLEKNEGVGGTW